MDTGSEIREFLTSRRARITPDQAGLTSYGPRRVPGLRREEVAVLAGVSVPYYTRIERGDMKGVSDSVLEALARALQLDEAERAHLFDLARAVRPMRPPRRRRAPRKQARPSIQHMLDAVTGAAAFVHNARLDNMATNELARALYSDMFGKADGPGPVNSARYVFLDPGARDFYADWERAASDVVAILRTAAGRDPSDRDLSDLVGELSTQSAEFRTRWAAHMSPLPRHRHQGPPPPRRRRPQPHLQPNGARCRPRTGDHDLHSGAQLQVRRGAQPPRKLGRNTRRGGHQCRSHRTAPRPHRGRVIGSRATSTSTRSRPPPRRRAWSRRASISPPAREPPGTHIPSARRSMSPRGADFASVAGGPIEE